MIDVLMVILGFIALLIWIPSWYLLDDIKAATTGKGLSSCALIWISGILIGFIVMYYLYPCCQ